MKKQSRQLASILLCVVATSSCSMQYNPDTPELPEKEFWKGGQGKALFEAGLLEHVSLIEEIPVSNWWEFLHDPILNALEERALQHSPTLKRAIDTLFEAKAAWGITRADLFPRIDLNTAAKRNKVPKNERGVEKFSRPKVKSTTIELPPPLPIFPAPEPIKIPVTKAAKLELKDHISVLQIFPELSYEIDFWGKIRQSSARDYEQFLATEDDLHLTALVLTATVANTYYELVAKIKDLEIIDGIIQALEKEKDLLIAQYHAGLIDKREGITVGTELDVIYRERAVVENDKMQFEHLLATLVGTPASTFIPETKGFPKQLPNIPLNIPPKVLKTRPDITQAEHLVEAARLNVGVAKAEFFPEIAVSAFYGYRADKDSRLFKWRSHVWELAAKALTPLFRGGKLTNQLKQAKAQYEQSVTNLIDRILTAYQEVEDALSSVDSTKTQLFWTHRAYRNAKQFLWIAKRRYKGGIVNYIDVARSRRRMLAVKRRVVRVTKDRLLATISLIRSIGGSWEDVAA